MANNLAINDKQKKFVQELVKCNNATQAAINAGYSAKTARVQASKLLTNPNILEYKQKLLSNLEKDSIASIQEILEYYTRVMRREEKESVVVTIKKKKSGWTTNKETGKREKVTIEEENAEVVEIPTKVSDANKAAEMLGKNYCIWTDKVNVTDDKVTIIEDLKPDE